MFFAGAFLALPMLAQNEPIRNPETDPKEIYLQDFESDWEEWSTTPVDTIDGVNYFLNDKYNPGSGIKIWENKSYQTGFIHRDTLINLYNGVMLSDNKDDFEGGDISKPETFKSKDSYTIVTDAPEDFTRQQALDEYGTKGGSKFFRFVSGDGTGVKNAGSGSVPEYRRNLFIRLTPGAIEENSSYRITMYIKTSKRESEEHVKNGTKANFRAELMRGYFSSEKNFSMGRDVSNTFTYSKDNFRDEKWEKITYMSYYLNAEIAEQFCYYNQYHDTWCDYWKWNAPIVSQTTDYDSLYIIRQPDKFFLRMSFRSDSTVFDVDNISITKSTIGGIQHTGNLIRVDFGYETNLKEQATAAKVRTNVPAVELPGQFFTVRGYKASTNKWSKIGISTAEYHDDGYLYMWAKPGAGGAQIKFESYDSVLVSFTNPTGVEYDTLSLKYTGTLYPNALDKEWVDAGKKVFDFTNEVSTPNPNIATGVYQMKNFPPVLRPNGGPYEDGAFGIDPSMNKITLKMSRKLDIDPEDVNGTGEKAFCQVFKDGVKVETWPATESTDTYTTFTRQASTPLSGDYTFKFIQIKGIGDSKYSSDIVLNYHFGTFDKNPKIIVYAQSDWRAHIQDFGFGGKNTTRPLPDNIYMHSGLDKFIGGTGVAKSTKLGLYPIKNDTMTVGDTKVPDNCFFYLSSRSASATGNLYSIEHLTPGVYAINFKFAGRSSTDYPMSLYFYAKPDGDLQDGNDNGFKKLEDVANKTVLESERKPVKADMGEGGFDQAWKDGTELLSYKFTVDAEKDYVFEWVSTGSDSYYGVVIGNYWITNTGDFSFTPVNNLNKAIASVTAKLASVTENKYKGPDYSALQAVETAGKGFIDATIAANKGNLPSAYAAQVKSMEDAINALQLHMDTVDLFYTAYDTVTKAIADQAKYSALEAYTKLNALKTQYASYDCSRYTNKQISDDTDILNAGVKNLNDRIVKHDDFAELLDTTKKILDSVFVVFKKPQLLGSELFEYDTLNQVYEYALAQKTSISSMTDSAFFALYDGLVELRIGYVHSVDIVPVRTRQIRELYVLADSLGYDFGGEATKDSIKALVYDLRKKDPELENVLRQAVVLQIYKKFAAKETFDTLDVSALVPNYFLGSEAEMGVTMRKKSSGTMVVNSSNNDLIFPGWNLIFGGSSATCYPGKKAITVESEVHPFIGGLHFEPNTTGTISTTATDMPIAEYYATITLDQNNLSNGYVTVKTDSAKMEIKGTKATTSKTYEFNKVKIALNKKQKVSGLTYSYSIASASGSGHVDVTCVNLYLTKADPKYNYTELAAAQEAKLADMITFVAPVAVAAEPIAVQYYNLNGVRVLAPEAGKVVIKRTILSNGKSVAEKILVK